MAKNGYWGVLAAAAVVAAFAYGCGGPDTVDDAVDHGGSLVSEEGQIAFTRYTRFAPPDFESEVYTINVDGSGEKGLTDSPGLDAFPAWSPDGEKIAYVTGVIDGNETIHVMNTDGSGRKRLAEGNWPSWSPDGERIVYTVYSADEKGRLVVMNADGSGQRDLEPSVLQRLLALDGADEELAWSPDGEKIAFASEVDGEIYAMHSDGSGRNRLTGIPGYDHWPPTWSADGTRIAFTSEGTKGSEIYAMNSDGSGLTKLTDNPVEDSFPAWRP